MTFYFISICSVIICTTIYTKAAISLTEITPQNSQRSDCISKQSKEDNVQRNAKIPQLKRSERFWNAAIERKVNEKEVEFSTTLPYDLQFVDVRTGCGRLKNRFVVAASGDSYCARYRDNKEQLQGEISSYSLSKLLQLPNVPQPFLIKVTFNSSTWTQVAEKLKQSGWKSGEAVILTLWINQLQPVLGPKYIFGDEQTQQSNCKQNQKVLFDSDAVFLLQWTDLILFDFLTGNLDRFISHLHSLKAGDKNAMLHPIHNLKQTTKGFLVFLDNESGFGHSYRIISQYNHLHLEALESICILRKSTSEKLELFHLMTESELESQLQNIFSKQTDKHQLLPPLSKAHIRTLKTRIEIAYKHFSKDCNS